MKKFVVNEETTLENFTDNVYAQASFCFRTLLKTREIRVNGKKTGENVRLFAGDEVCYYLTEKQEQKPAFTLLYEDENVLAIDKESGVNSEAVFSALRERGEVYFIHRLDRNTAGVMLFAKNARAEDKLLAAFSGRNVEKIYLALVVGFPKKHEVCTAYLKKDEKKAFVTVSDKPIGEKIVTEYEALERRQDASLLKVTLHTGKTHQIRAHLAFLGFPVAGDMKYGDIAYNRAHSLTRQRLIAKELCVFTDGFLSYLKDRRFVSEKNL